MEKLEEIITKKELMDYYGIHRDTIEVWVKKYNLPLIEISTHIKYVKKDEFLKWEENLKKNSK
ncbi:hypothetical protein [[Muricauda] lutisoli]|uniref:DNA-binding protein n=1 Tax=[Muricauda] lutisoli TaxID=2816035 RepID=A0ABS3EU36_9FLAO|nr:hypothetical protein [[Muricauda] lutisoli]MBO0329749.1 hypothetical protein [[Muricauda] lutisoli]